MTDRISWTSGAPTTQFIMECDRVGQDVGGNFTRLAIYMRAINRGSTSSFDSGYGEQVGTIDNVWAAAVHSGSPFLPRGAGTGAQRWRDGPWYVDIGHDANGYRGGVTLRQRISAPSFNNESTAWFDDFPRIPKVPQPPTMLSVSDILPTSFGATFQGGDAMGSNMEQWHAEWSRADNGAVVWDDYATNGYTNPRNGAGPSLIPGTTYRVRARGRNGVGWGGFSGYIYATTLGAGRRWNGTEWVNVRGRRWNGSSWVDLRARRWDGTQWKDLR